MSDKIIRWLGEQIVRDNVILFVGSGPPTAGDASSPTQEIADALARRIDYQKPDRSLAAVARDFEVLQGRHELITAIREIAARQENQPSPIHQLIAETALPQTKLITTRFDQKLEEALRQFNKQFVLIVSDADVPSFDESLVTLIKLHGDISQPTSLVITLDDLDAFVERLPTISDVIRAFFATKTVVFLGYDLNNETFKRFFQQVMRRVTAFQRPAYAVVPQPLDEVETAYWQNRHVTILPQNQELFLQKLAREVKEAARRPEPAANPLAQIAHPPRPSQPYKSLDSFTSDDAAIFSGRAEESQRLTNRILAHRLVVLYGESGSGKTSLLQAGVAPRLAEKRALLAAIAPAAGQPLAILIHDSLRAAGEAAGLQPTGDNDLAATIRQRQQTLDGPIVLALDQFEQFFLAYDEAARQTAVALLQNLIADRSLDLRLLFIIREDFLGRLQSLEAALPGLLDIRFRLERLGREAARSAIEEPARLFNVAWEPALVETLLNDLYSANQGGVAPPQLQIICDYLYQDVAQGNGDERNGAPVITLARFQELGGTETILGDYLERTVAEFTPEEQPAARRLMGALVTSGGVKQRLPLAELMRAAEVRPELAQPVLDKLTAQRLLNRYEILSEGDAQPGLAYELTHDYLAARILSWLGEAFWRAQKVRETLRHALPGWQEENRLPGPDDWRLIDAHRGQLHFSPLETEFIYATAVTYAEDPTAWETTLSAADCRVILLRLCQHSETFARERAARRLAQFPGEEATAVLVEMTLADREPAVRQTAAQTLAQIINQEAITQLAPALNQPDTATAAQQALATIRDAAPESHALLPPDLRGSFQRQAWAARWRRQRYAILTATLQGAQGGFWGLALGLGLFLGLNNLVLSGFRLEFVRFSAIVSAVSVGMPLAGLVGAATGGASALAGAILGHLPDRSQKWRTWGVVTAVGGLTMALGFVAMGAIFAGQLQTLRAATAGLLIGAALTGTAALPLPWPTPLRLTTAVLAGIVAFSLSWAAGLIFSPVFWWLIVMGTAGGVGFFGGLNRQTVSR